MNNSINLYKRYRFPAGIIQYAVWLYHRFNISYRDIEGLLAERGITESYESIRLWCNKFGPQYAKRLKSRHKGFGDTFYIDKVFVKIDGKQQAPEFAHRSMKNTLKRLTVRHWGSKSIFNKLFLYIPLMKSIFLNP